MIMRVTGFSAVAAIVLVLASTVLISSMSRVSLAQVVQAVGEYPFCRFTWVEVNKNTDGLEPGIDVVTTERTVSVDLGARSVPYGNGNRIQRFAVYAC